jgi:hypothetical protein
MAAQEYVIRSIKKAGTNKGAYGEYQNYALAVAGIGEPVKLSLPQPIIEDPEIGDHLFGRLTQRKGSGDQLYYELKLEPRSADDLRQLDIHAQVALKLAIDVWLNTSYKTKDERAEAYKNIQKEAVHFGRMINIIKQELK